MAIDAVEIILTANCGLGADPSSYTGRGNTTSDLDSSKLEKIYAVILRRNGADAAKAFVNMVNGLDDNASASNFLRSLYDLDMNDWVYVPRKPISTAKEILETASDAMNKQDHKKMGAAVTGAFSFFGSPHAKYTREAALQITSAFLRHHKDEIIGEPAFKGYERALYRF